ncbi:MAG TPA: hypothetical protein VF595_15715 [Tepidisphaeraceae bacterium]|jgi:hypothetical protein
MSHLLESLEDRKLFATYGTDGSVALTFDTADARRDYAKVGQLLLDSAGRSYVVATTNRTVQVKRLTAAGALDTAWGEGGTVTLKKTNEAGIGVKAVLDPSGRLTVLNKNQLVRYVADGSVDTAFGTNGLVSLTDFAAVTDVAIDTRNRLYVTGYYDPASKTISGQNRVQRLLSRGRIDRMFASRGTYDLPAAKTPRGYAMTSSGGHQLRALADGSVVLAGTIAFAKGGATTPATGGVQTARFTAGGALDAGYGSGGTFTYVRPIDSSLAVRLNNIRGNGVVSLFVRDGANGPNLVDTTNAEIKAEGTLNLAKRVRYDSTATGHNKGVSARAFIARPGGGEFVLQTYGVSAVSSGGGFDASYNNGGLLGLANRFSGPIVFGGSLGVAVRPDGSFLAAVTGPGRTDVEVKLFNADGTD